MSPYMFVMGAIFAHVMYVKERILFRIQLGSLIKWTLLLLTAGIIKYFFFRLANNYSIDILPNTSAVSSIPIAYMFIAGLEEIIFTLPMYYIKKYSNNVLIKYILGLALAALFASGHLYQGVGAVIVTFIYMFFVAPKLLPKLGLGTMVLGHIIFDVISWSLVQAVSKI